MFRWPLDYLKMHHRLTLTCAFFRFLHWKCRHANWMHFAAFCSIENYYYSSFTSQKGPQSKTKPLALYSVPTYPTHLAQQIPTLISKNESSMN